MSTRLMLSQNPHCYSANSAFMHLAHLKLGPADRSYLVNVPPRPRLTKIIGAAELTLEM